MNIDSGYPSADIQLRKERPNWPWIVGSGLLGGALIGLAFWLESAHEWQGVSIATLVAVGSILLLTGVGFLLERRFVREIGRATSESVESTVDERIEAANEQISLRMNQLEELMEVRQQQRRSHHDAAIDAMDEPTFETVASAMAVANKIGAIRYGRITVQGSLDPDELGLTFSWGYDYGDGRFGIGGRNGLIVHAELYSDIFDGSVQGGRPVIEVEWKPGDAADRIGMELREQLERRGRWISDNTLRWVTALRNLQSALDIAVKSRRRDEGSPWLVGALSDYIDDLWMITEAGLECPARRFILSGDEFPKRTFRPWAGEGSDWNPQRPPWVDQVTWERLIRRGRLRFPVRRGPSSAIPTWMPQTKMPSELLGDEQDA